jgi:hypothetical protein
MGLKLVSTKDLRQRMDALERTVLAAISRLEGKLMASAEEIKGMLTMSLERQAAAKVVADKIDADVTRLIEMVGQPGDGEISAVDAEEIRALATSLVQGSQELESKLAATDARTPEPEPPAEG